MEKNAKKKKKRLTYGPNNARRVVWACFSYRRPAQPSPSIYNMNKTKKKQKKTVRMNKKQRKKKKDLPMAQTTQNVSFGPVFLIAGQPNPLRPFITRIGPK